MRESKANTPTIIQGNAAICAIEYSPASRNQCGFMPREPQGKYEGFGILNTNIPADHPMMYGIPWPGDYLITSEGTVRDKLFLV